MPNFAAATKGSVQQVRNWLRANVQKGKAARGPEENTLFLVGPSKWHPLDFSSAGASRFAVFVDDKTQLVPSLAVIAVEFVEQLLGGEVLDTFSDVPFVEKGTDGMLQHGHSVLVRLPKRDFRWLEENTNLQSSSFC